MSSLPFSRSGISGSLHPGGISLAARWEQGFYERIVEPQQQESLGQSAGGGRRGVGAGDAGQWLAQSAPGIRAGTCQEEFPLLRVSSVEILSCAGAPGYYEPL